MANSVPTLGGLLSSVTFAEDTVSATPQLLDADVTFTDLDNDVAGATLTVSGLLAEDIVSIRNQGMNLGEIGFSGSSITYDGNVIDLRITRCARCARARRFATPRVRVRWPH
jgi:hypothetical protein